MKNPYVRKRPIYSLREFLEGIPQPVSFLEDLYPEREPDACTEMRINWTKYRAKRDSYFKRYKFWHMIAKLLNRKEVK